MADLTSLEIIDYLKWNDEIRDEIAGWIRSTDPWPIIREWFAKFWPNNDFSLKNLHLPQGHSWTAKESSKYILTLGYDDFNDRHKCIDLCVEIEIRENTPYDESIRWIEVVQIY